MTGQHRSTLDVDSVVAGEVITRGEEIEVDDTREGELNKLKPYYKRSEPKPWGTLRLKDFEARYQAMHWQLNAMSVVVFCMLFGGYLSKVTFIPNP